MRPRVYPVPTTQGLFARLLEFYRPLAQIPIKLQYGSTQRVVPAELIGIRPLDTFSLLYARRLRNVFDVFFWRKLYVVF